MQWGLARLCDKLLLDTLSATRFECYQRMQPLIHAQGVNVPAATAIDPAATTPLGKFGRDDWVDMQLAKSFMRETKRSLPASLAVTWIMAAVLSKAAPMLELLAWVILSNIFMLLRYLVVLQYQSKMRDIAGDALRHFLCKYDILWLSAGLLWGLSSLLFFEKSTGFEQFICGLILVGVSCFSVYSYSSRLTCFFSFTNALSGAAVAVVVYQLLVKQSLPSSSDSLGLIALTVVFHLLVRYFAIHFHSLQRQSLQLKFDNSQLIESLTAKTNAALDAVDNKDRFIASAAHDLRQPVHALNLYASWLVDEPELSPQVAPQIVRCTNAVNDLFNSLFDFSGLNAESPAVDWQPVDLAKLLADLQHQYAPLAQQNGLRLRLHSGDACTRSNAVLLKRLLGNLISNAVKNTRQGGVLLALRQRKARWRIEVWDTGVGIDAEHQEAIFQEFYRVPSQGTDDGFGLGLAIVSRLSEVLGLRVGVRSTIGRGSVFWVEGKRDSPATGFEPPDYKSPCVRAR